MVHFFPRDQNSSHLTLCRLSLPTLWVQSSLLEFLLLPRSFCPFNQDTFFTTFSSLFSSGNERERDCKSFLPFLFMTWLLTQFPSLASSAYVKCNGGAGEPPLGGRNGVRKIFNARVKLDESFPHAESCDHQALRVNHQSWQKRQNNATLHCKPFCPTDSLNQPFSQPVENSLHWGQSISALKFLGHGSNFCPDHRSFHV